MKKLAKVRLKWNRSASENIKAQTLFITPTKVDPRFFTDHETTTDITLDPPTVGPAFSISGISLLVGLPPQTTQYDIPCEVEEGIPVRVELYSHWETPKESGAPFSTKFPLQPYWRKTEQCLEYITSLPTKLDFTLDL